MSGAHDPAAVWRQRLAAAGIDIHRLIDAHAATVGHPVGARVIFEDETGTVLAVVIFTPPLIVDDEGDAVTPMLIDSAAALPTFHVRWFAGRIW